MPAPAAIAAHEPHASHAALDARAAVVGALRRMRATAAERATRAKGEGGACECCGTGVHARHRHLLDLERHVILCVCESCWMLRSGDPAFRPTGHRTERLEAFDLPDDLWAAFQIPIGLAFFFTSGPERRPVAFYPSPAGAVESDLTFAAWGRLVELNPVLESLEPEAEAVLVHKRGAETTVTLLPLDDCYRLVGTMRMAWRGITGGPEVEAAIARFFDGLLAREVGR